jgi:hypothetical protein
MTSILKVDTIQDQSGNNIINENADTITIGASGDTITVPTGASLTVPSGGLSGQNYPAFEATLSSEQVITANTITKVQYNTEKFDTDSAYDNATNYRFTVPAGKDGKYIIYYSNYMRANEITGLQFADCLFSLNGTTLDDSFVDLRNGGDGHQFQISTIALDLIATDYIEIFARIAISSGTCQINGGGGGSVSVFCIQ